jgi:peptidoglycan hydrolase-like protein with peptidoglycan-binding domain
VSPSLVAELEGTTTARIDRPRADAPRDLNRSGESRRMSQAELISQTQAELRRLGYPITFIGGRLNGETSDAIRDYQQRRGLEPTGMPSRPLLAQMRREAGNVMGRGISPPAPLPPYPATPGRAGEVRGLAAPEPTGWRELSGAAGPRLPIELTQISSRAVHRRPGTQGGRELSKLGPGSRYTWPG